MNKKRYTIDENYFEQIVTEEQAYVLGVIYSDGCIYKLPTAYGLEITQIEQDKDILVKIKDLLKSEYPLAEGIQKSNNKKSYRLYAYSKKIFDDLVKLGVTPRKSLTLEFPTFLDDRLMPHFIRGVFDGDGCIWNGKRKKVLVKDKTSKNGMRERIIHNVKFTFTGNENFILSLQKFLNRKIGLSMNKLNYSKANNPNNTTSQNVCTLEYSGRGNIKKLYDFLYSNAKVYGLRKYEKFNEILCANNK